MAGTRKTPAALTEDDVRRIAREEVASLAGLVLRRSRDQTTHHPGTALARVFGEALRDFGGTESEPGE